jgi:hypothetical protein
MKKTWFMMTDDLEFGFLFGNLQGLKKRQQGYL